MTPYYTYKKSVPGGVVGFTKGRGYYARAGGAVVPPADPFAAWTPQQINAMIDHAYGSPMPDAQIQSHAQAEIDPLISNVTGRVNTSTQNAIAGIRAGSDALAKALAATDYGAPYAAPIQQQAAVDSALQQSLSGGGTQLAQDLSARLGQIGDPAVAQAAAATSQQGAALGNTELARGSSALSNLIANSGALREYGAKQPGIARQQGLQGIAQASQQGINAISDQTGEILRQLPSIVASLRGENADKRSNRAQMFETLLGQNITKATARAGLTADNKKATAAAAPQLDPTLTNLYGYSVDQYGNPWGGTVKPLPGYTTDKNGNVVPTPKPTKPDTSTRPNAALSGTFGYIVDSTGRPILRNGKRIPVAKSPKSTSAHQPSAALSRIYGYVVDANGKPILDAHGKRIKVAKTTATSPFDVTPTLPGG